MTSLPYQKTANVTWVIGVAIVLTMPDSVFGLVVELSHLALELAHVLFELFESALDHFIEHTFHTGTKETQIIVFYIILTLALGGLYFVFRTTQRLLNTLKDKLLADFLRHKNRLLMFWQESAANKFKLIAWFHVALTIVVLFGF
jgi:hypothetical protein